MLCTLLSRSFTYGLTPFLLAIITIRAERRTLILPSRPGVVLLPIPSGSLEVARKDGDGLLAMRSQSQLHDGVPDGKWAVPAT
jgi:hypothetical protein